jgi:hypothetical protein
MARKGSSSWLGFRDWRTISSLGGSIPRMCMGFSLATVRDSAHLSPMPRYSPLTKEECHASKGRQH